MKGKKINPDGSCKSVNVFAITNYVMEKGGFML